MRLEVIEFRLPRNKFNADFNHLEVEIDRDLSNDEIFKEVNQKITDFEKQYLN